MTDKKKRLLLAIAGATCLTSFGLGILTGIIEAKKLEDVINHPSEKLPSEDDSNNGYTEELTEKPTEDLIVDLPDEIESNNEEFIDNTEENHSYNDNSSTIKPSNMNYAMLVNRENTISKNFVPSNLRTLNIPFVGNKSSNKMDSYAGAALEKMFADAKADGVILHGRSGYRSYNTQKINYENKVVSIGQTQADKYVAKPGASEHQTGLAMDIVTKGYNKLDSGFKNTKAYSWLIENCAEYGFILRYPEGKSHITGYNFEPWHYRYVGVEHARIIMKNKLTLEEYHSQYLNKDTEIPEQNTDTVEPEYNSPSYEGEVTPPTPSAPDNQDKNDDNNNTSNNEDTNIEPIVPDIPTTDNDTPIISPPSNDDIIDDSTTDPIVPAIPPDLTDNPDNLLGGLENDSFIQ